MSEYKDGRGDYYLAEGLREQREELRKAKLERDLLRLALREIEPLQGKMLAMIEREGFVFATTGNPDPLTDAERWEKLAFTLYTHLADASTQARMALEP